MISRNCIQCRKSIELPVTESEIKEWQDSGDLIQRALPQLNDGQRELLISGICDPCFEAIFAGDEDDEGRCRMNGFELIRRAEKAERLADLLTYGQRVSNDRGPVEEFCGGAMSGKLSIRDLMAREVALQRERKEQSKRDAAERKAMLRKGEKVCQQSTK